MQWQSLPLHAQSRPLAPRRPKPPKRGERPGLWATKTATGHPELLPRIVTPLLCWLEHSHAGDGIERVDRHRFRLTV